MDDLMISIHDTYIDYTGISLNVSQIEVIVELLPKEIVLKAEMWGGGDTEVRDDIFLWVRDDLKRRHNKVNGLEG